MKGTFAVTMNDKMKVEIWSDVMCPFCYIGKKKFEQGLAQFSNPQSIEIEWKSFQLMPELEAGTSTKIEELLVEKRGYSPSQIQQMNARVQEMGMEVGIDFQFDKILGVNTLDAHRFLHFAQAQGKSNEAEEALFYAYFTEGKNVGDLQVLHSIGEYIGLDAESLQQTLENNQYLDAVENDIYEAQQVGVRGVPFFVFDRKYAVSGAQDPSVFLNTMTQSYAEWQKENSSTL